MSDKTQATLTLAKAVKRHRLAAGLTQRELARRVELAPDTISLIERAKQPNVGLRNLEALADALGVELYRLFLDDPDALNINLVVSDQNVQNLQRILDKVEIAIIRK